MNVSELFGELHGIQVFAKLHHLAVSRTNGAYAIHTALGEFYDLLEDLTDTLIESYQGKFGVVKAVRVKDISVNAPASDRLKVFACMLECCTALGDKAENSYLYNQLDEIITLTYRTIYKLDNLKNS